MASWNACLPGVAIHGHMVVMAGAESVEVEKPDSTILNFSNLQKSEALDFFSSLYPDLGIYHWAHLWEWLQHPTVKNSFPFSFADLTEFVHLHISRDFEIALAHFWRAPASFQQWALDKKLQGRDLVALQSWPQALWSQSILEMIAMSPLSKSDALQCIEWLGDLAGMDVDFSGVWSMPAAQWLQQLRKLRFAESAARDASAKNWLAAVPKAKGLSWQWVRQGDQTGVDIRAFVRGPQELERQLESLKKLFSAWSGRGDLT